MGKAIFDVTQGGRCCYGNVKQEKLRERRMTDKAKARDKSH